MGTPFEFDTSALAAFAELNGFDVLPVEDCDWNSKSSNFNQYGTLEYENTPLDNSRESSTCLVAQYIFVEEDNYSIQANLVDETEGQLSSKEQKTNDDFSAKSEKGLENDELSNAESGENYSKKYSLRPDVVYKNIFRSIKKFYTGKFKEHSNLFSIRSKSQRKKMAPQCVKNFTQACILDNDKTGIFNGVDLEEVADYMGRIMIPEFVTKFGCNYECRKYIELLYKCIYKFNKSVADKLYVSDVIGRIFKYLYISDEFEYMLATDSTLSQHKDTYRALMKEVVESFTSSA